MPPLAQPQALPRTTLCASAEPTCLQAPTPERWDTNVSPLLPVVFFKILHYPPSTSSLSSLTGSSLSMVILPQNSPLAACSTTTCNISIKSLLLKIQPSLLEKCFRLSALLLPWSVLVYSIRSPPKIHILLAKTEFQSCGHIPRKEEKIHCCTSLQELPCIRLRLSLMLEMNRRTLLEPGLLKSLTVMSKTK